MAFETVRDILDRMRNFHTKVSEYYHQLYCIADKERVKLLLDYMSRHEKHIEKCISEYENDASKDILDTWFMAAPASTHRECFEDSDLNHDMSIDDILTVAMCLNDCLINVFKRIIESTEYSNIKEIFRSLLSLEEQERRKMVNESLELKEI